MRKMIVAAVAAPLALALFAPAMADGHKVMATVEHPITSWIRITIRRHAFV